MICAAVTLRYLMQKIKASSGPIGDLKAFAEQQLHAAYNTVADNFNSGSIKIYRMITAPEDWEPEPDGSLGIYWSWDRDYAHTFWGSDMGNNPNGDNTKWLITATATSDDLDWFTTLVANAQPSFENEREITLKKRTDGLTVLSIEPCPANHPNS